jgi:phosphocarrier protein
VKSLIGVLSLAVTKDALIKVVASGDDEALAVEEIVKLVETLED